MESLYPSRANSPPQCGPGVYSNAWLHFVYRLGGPRSLPLRYTNDIIYSCLPELAQMVSPLLRAGGRIQ